MKTIAIRGDFIRKERVATGAVTPGMQVSLAGAAGGGTRKAFALENSLVGEDIDDAYAIGDTIQEGLFPTGAEVYAWLATGENVAAGASLVGNGAGALAEAGSGEDADVIAFALEAVNNTAGETPVRIKVEVA